MSGSIERNGVISLPIHSDLNFRYVELKSWECELSGYFHFIKVCRRTSEDLSVFVVFPIKGLPTTSEDLSVFVLFLLFIILSFLFFSTADFLQRFLRYFSTNLNEIWQVYSPWWDEEPEYNLKSIGPGVGIRRGPKVLLCFIIGKTLYTVRRDKSFT